MAPMRTDASQHIVAHSDTMGSLLADVAPVARSEMSVLLIGETGVGKELLADHIHRLSPRSTRPLVKISLSAMPHDLLETELFGHERGAFTSAQTHKRGLFEVAHQGSLFLDDVDDIPLSFQVKLLRVLESREFMRVGGTKSIPGDFRLISASKVDLGELIEHSGFRSDLYYRINGMPFEIPPLRKRLEDIVPLFEHFLRRFAPQKSLHLSSAAKAVLGAYPWPGNVRELRNVAQRLALLSCGTIDAEDLPVDIQEGRQLRALVRACRQCFVGGRLSYREVVACVETNLLRDALASTNGNRTLAAKRLGLSLSTLRDKLTRFGLKDALADRNSCDIPS